MQEVITPEQQLTMILREAADDKPEAIEAFFEQLLRATVYVPLKPPMVTKNSNDIKEIGGKGAGINNFTSVDYMGNECIPIFSEKRFVEDWAEKDLACVEKEFKTLLQLLGDETWLYINPGQDVGKELTAWELERLRKGRDAIPELAAALNESPIGEIEVNVDIHAFAKLKEKLLPIFQIYPELEEAFIVSVKESGDETERPMVGLLWKNANPAKREYIRTEIETAVQEYLEDDGGNVFIIDDLGNDDSPNHTLFSDAKPVYLNKKIKADSKIAGLWSAIGKKIKGD